MSSDSTGLRARYDAATRRLIIDWPGGSGIGTPEEWEMIERFIRQERCRVRVDAYEGKWPDGFLKQIANL